MRLAMLGRARGRISLRPLQVLVTVSHASIGRRGTPCAIDETGERVNRYVRGLKR
jgi:hypothetical protein